MKTDYRFTVPIIVIIFVASACCDYVEPVALESDKKIMSRDVKCLGKTVQIQYVSVISHDKCIIL